MSDKVKIDAIETAHWNGVKLYERCANCQRELQPQESRCPVCFPKVKRG